MSWSYASTEITTTDRYWVRWRLGLTSSSEQLQQDEEIDAALASYGTKQAAAAAVARAISMSFARRADMTMGKLSISHSQKSERWDELAKKVEIEIGSGGDAPVPWAAAHSHSRKDAIEEGTDRVEPFFSRGMHDYPGTSDIAELSTS